jgi:hypothetical protein
MARNTDTLNPHQGPNAWILTILSKVFLIVREFRERGDPRVKLRLLVQSIYGGKSKEDN